MDERSEWQKRMGVGEKNGRFGVHVGTVKETPVYREDNGKLGGKQTEHWNGRVDATIIAPTLVKDAKTGEINSES